MSSSKKKRRISSSDESDIGVEKKPEITDPVSNGTTPQGRSSSRISIRKNKVYHKPTRDEIWDKIPSSRETNLSHITPTKKVNNLLRVHNKYNADSCDIFNDDFIDDEEEIVYSSSLSTDTEDQEWVEKKKKKKIQNRRRRLKFECSSSEDEAYHSKHETENDDNQLETMKKQTEEETDDNTNKYKSNTTEILESMDNKGDNLSNNSDIKLVDTIGSDSEEDSNICLSTSMGKHKNVLKSDDESESNEDESESNENNEDESESNEDEDKSGNLSRIQKQSSKKDSKFQNFKEAQARLKEKHRLK